MRQESPTLVAGERFVSLLAPVPPALGEKITLWQGQHGMPASQIHSHITVFLGAEPQNWQLLGELEEELAALGPVTVSLGAPATFLPDSPVSYLSIAEGASALEGYHRACCRLLGESASPFAYVPHLTLALRLSAEDIAQSLADFSNLPRELSKFSLEKLEVYSFDGSNWSFVRELSLA